MSLVASAVGRFPVNHVYRAPSGKWAFVGRVDARLLYCRPDGSEPDDKDLVDAARFGPGGRLRHKVWDTKEAAIRAARALGLGWCE